MLKQFDRTRREFDLTIHWTIGTQELHDQRQNIARPLAQRQHGQFEGADTEIEIFTELTLGNRFTQILIGGGDQTYIEFNGRITTKTCDFAFLQHAQEFGLKVIWHLGDFIQEDRAAMRLLKQTTMLFQCTGKGALLVTKQ